MPCWKALLTGSLEHGLNIAPVRVHHEDVPVSVLEAVEHDLISIRRPRGVKIVVSVSRELFRITSAEWHAEDLLVAADIRVVYEPPSVWRYRAELDCLVASRYRPRSICARDVGATISCSPDVGNGREDAVCERLAVTADRDGMRVETRSDSHRSTISAQVALQSLEIDVARASHVRHEQDSAVRRPDWRCVEVCPLRDSHRCPTAFSHYPDRGWRNVADVSSAEESTVPLRISDKLSILRPSRCKRTNSTCIRKSLSVFTVSPRLYQSNTVPLDAHKPRLGWMQCALRQAIECLHRRR